MIYKNKFKENFKQFSFFANEDKITPKKVIKILGSYIKDDLKLDSQVGKVTGQLHNRIHKIKAITKYTNFKTRLSFMNAHIIGKINYILPLYMHADQNLKTKTSFNDSSQSCDW